jgi:hypothetical protein
MTDTPTVRVPAAAPAGTTTPTAKPGWKTSEFWLSSLATVGGILLASGAVAEGTAAAQVVGGIVAVLASLGYTASRTALKREQP